MSKKIEEIYPEFHIERLKSTIRSMWTNDCPVIDKVCLYRGGRDFDKYWLVIFRPKEFQGETMTDDFFDAKFRSKLPNLFDVEFRSELAKCMKDDLFIIHDWFITCELEDEYENCDWAYEAGAYQDKDGTWVSEKWFYVDLESELVLFERQLTVAYRSKTEKTGQEKRPRHSQLVRNKVREIAKHLWTDNPRMTKPEIVWDDEINKVAVNKSGQPYAEETIGDWVADLNPNRNPGRRSKKAD